MKIHDKFVIELAEVIKGFGNDYRVKEPANLPCDYKFYEIGGVAICEESVKKMKPLNEEINKVLDEVLDKIISDIENIKYLACPQPETVLSDVKDIITKYKESEGKE